MYLVPGGVSSPGAVPSPGGVYLVQGGVPGPRGLYLVPGGYLAGPGGVVPGPGGGVPGQVLPHPVDRITDACKNITLPQLRCGR